MSRKPAAHVGEAKRLRRRVPLLFSQLRRNGVSRHFRVCKKSANVEYNWLDLRSTGCCAKEKRKIVGVVEWGESRRSPDYPGKEGRTYDPNVYSPYFGDR